MLNFHWRKDFLQSSASIFTILPLKFTLFRLQTWLQLFPLFSFVPFFGRLLANQRSPQYLLLQKSETNSRRAKLTEIYNQNKGKILEWELK